MPHTKAGKVFTDLILETFRFHGRLLAAGDRLSEPLGLTSARWQVLGAIEQQARSVAQIARTMGVARQNVQRIADVLCTEGVVSYSVNPDHQRAKLVCLTTQGRRKMKALARRQAVWANHIASCASEAELRSALGLTARLRSQLE